MDNNLGLLKFCLENSDGKPQVGIPPRDPKDYEWLKEAFNSTETDVQKMKKIIALLSNTDSDESSITLSLEELQFLVEDIDNAKDLFKINGFEPLLNALKSDSMSNNIKSLIAFVISTLLHNNEETQQKALKSDVLPFTVKLLNGTFSADTPDEKLIFKLFSVISGLVKYNSDTLKEFVDNLNGFKIFYDLLSNSNFSLTNKMKVIFILRYILFEELVLVSSKVKEFNLIPILIPYLQTNSIDVNEKTLQVFIQFLNESSQDNIDECNKYNLEDVLKDQIKKIDSESKDENKQEELKLLNECLELLQKSGKTSTTSSSSAVLIVEK